MTLRCWMHWFWITALLLVLESSRWTSALPQHAQSYASTEVSARFDSGLEAEQVDSKPGSARRGKALYFDKTAQTTAPLARTTPAVPSKGPDVSEVDRGAPSKDVDQKQDSKNVSEVAITQNVSNISAEVVEEDNAPMKISLLLNETQTVPVTVKMGNDSITASTEGKNGTNRTNATVSKPLVVEDSESDSESDSEGGASSRRAVLTQRPLSLAAGGAEVRGGRGARVSLEAAGGARALDAGAVAGLAFAALALVALAGAVGFVLYRRRYLNKPQTLNDKCSNPDSSGYIDDSTIRENSEEMYSLDNDSFLNSLEAMTIQNYWTDSVKHTKL